MSSYRQIICRTTRWRELIDRDSFNRLHLKDAVDTNELRKEIEVLELNIDIDNDREDILIYYAIIGIVLEYLRMRGISVAQWPYQSRALSSGAVLAQKIWGAWSPVPTRLWAIQIHRERALKESGGPEQKLGGLGPPGPSVEPPLITYHCR
jgi:hypothetical protein